MSDQQTVPGFVEALGDFSQTYQRNLIVIACIIIVVAIVIFVMYTQRRVDFKNIDENGAFVKYDNQIVDVSGRPPIAASDLIQAQIPLTFTYAFWMHITNWYTNYGYWKHVMHRGQSVATGCKTKADYDTLPDQYPGIWLGDVTNDMRVCFTTTKDKGVTRNIEFVDLKNVPVGEWFHFAVVLNERSVELYLNGNLHKTQILVFTPIESLEPASIGLGNTVSAKLSTIRYMPLSLSATEIERCYLREKLHYSSVSSGSIKNT